MVGKKGVTNNVLLLAVAILVGTIVLIGLSTLNPNNLTGYVVSGQGFVHPLSGAGGTNDPFSNSTLLNDRLDYVYLLKTPGPTFDSLIVGQKNNIWVRSPAPALTWTKYSAQEFCTDQENITNNPHNPFCNQTLMESRFDYYVVIGDQLVLGKNDVVWHRNSSLNWSKSNASVFCTGIVDEHPNNPFCNSTIIAQGLDYYVVYGASSNLLLLGKGRNVWERNASSNWNYYLNSNSSFRLLGVAKNQGNPFKINSRMRQGLDYVIVQPNNQDYSVVAGYKNETWYMNSTGDWTYLVLGNSWGLGPQPEDQPVGTASCYWPPTITNNNELAESIEAFRGFGLHNQLINITEYNTTTNEPVRTYTEDRMLCINGRVQALSDFYPEVNATNLENGYILITNRSEVFGSWYISNESEALNPTNFRLVWKMFAGDIPSTCSLKVNCNAQNVCVPTLDCPVSPDSAGSDGVCLPLAEGLSGIRAGLRAVNSSEVLVYCDPTTLRYIAAKNVTSSCVQDFECQSNVCIDGKCVSITQVLQDQSSTLKKIFCAIGSPIDFRSRNAPTANVSNNNYLRCLED